MISDPPHSVEPGFYLSWIGIENRPSIREDGVRKILDGVTTLEEVLRVTRGE